MLVCHIVQSESEPTPYHSQSVSSYVEPAGRPWTVLNLSKSSTAIGGHIIPILLTVILLPQLQTSLHPHQNPNISHSWIYYMLTASDAQPATVFMRIFTIPGNKHGCIMLKVTSFRVVLGLLPLAKVF